MKCVFTTKISLFHSKISCAQRQPAGRNAHESSENLGVVPKQEISGWENLIFLSKNWGYKKNWGEKIWRVNGIVKKNHILLGVEGNLRTLGGGILRTSPIFLRRNIIEFRSLSFFCKKWGDLLQSYAEVKTWSMQMWHLSIVVLKHEELLFTILIIYFLFWIPLTLQTSKAGWK